MEKDSNTATALLFESDSNLNDGFENQPESDCNLDDQLSPAHVLSSTNSQPT